MEIEQILTNLLKFGIEKEYFVTFKMGKIDKTCCKQSEIEVIDFDRTKEKIVAEFGYATIKSCDALKILPSLKRIDFIEMKGSLEFLKRNRDNSNEKVQKQVSKFDFEGKIKDSLHILDCIINKTNYLTGKERQQYSNIKKYYFIITDINLTENPLESIVLNIEHWGIMWKPFLIDKLQEKLDCIDIQQFKNLQPLILMDCEGIEKYYNELLS